MEINENDDGSIEVKYSKEGEAIVWEYLIIISRAGITQIEDKAALWSYEVHRKVSKSFKGATGYEAVAKPTEASWDYEKIPDRFKPYDTNISALMHNAIEFIDEWHINYDN